jgi:hypothetical protein
MGAIETMEIWLLLQLGFKKPGHLPLFCCALSRGGSELGCSVPGASMKLIRLKDSSNFAQFCTGLKLTYSFMTAAKVPA